MAPRREMQLYARASPATTPATSDASIEKTAKTRVETNLQIIQTDLKSMSDDMQAKEVANNKQFSSRGIRSRVSQKSSDHVKTGAPNSTGSGIRDIVHLQMDIGMLVVVNTMSHCDGERLFQNKQL